MRTWIALATLMLTGWFGSGAALAQPAKTARSVADDVGLFSAEAEAKANSVIARIKQQHQKDLVIETTQAPKRPAGLDVNDKAATNRFFDEWAATRFKNQQINGVYVVIVDKPKIIRVVVGAKTLDKGIFTKANRDELFKTIQEKLRADDADGALLGAVAYVADTMQKNARTTGGAAPQAAPPANKTRAPATDDAAQPDAAQPQVQASPIVKWLLIGLAILLVFWLVSAVIRGLSGMGAGAAGYSSGGGGFLSGMLGGLFGAAAGMWMYNHFFGGGGPSAYAGPSNPGGYNPNDATDVGAGEPSVGGGDYDTGAVDEPTDAGDWGSGGGDWSGGGGDWSGGGGGDW